MTERVKSAMGYLGLQQSERPLLPTELMGWAPAWQAGSDCSPGRFSGPYTVSVIDSLPEFGAIAFIWDNLLQRCGIEYISLYHRWLSLWLEIFNPRGVFILLVRDEIGDLIAAAPFCISRNPSGLFSRLLRRVQFIGTHPEVYDAMRVIIHPRADADRVLFHLAEALRQHQHRWDVLDWRYMDEADQLHRLLEALQPGLHHYAISQPMSIPYIQLPEIWQNPPPYRKKKYQSDLNRISNHLQRDYQISQPRLVVHSPGPSGDAIVSTFLKAHQAYWLDRGCRSEYARHHQLMGFYQGIYHRFSDHPSRGSLATPIFELSTLELGGEPISYHFDIQTPQGCMGYLSCYEPEARKYRPGHLHIEALIERTHHRGGRRFEFGRGDESYKNQWHVARKPLWNLLAFAHPFARRLWQLDARLKDRPPFRPFQQAESAES